MTELFHNLCVQLFFSRRVGPPWRRNPMSWHRLVLSMLFAGTVLAPTLAQNPVVPQPPIRGSKPPSSQKSKSTTHPRQQPCWEVAGISKAAIERRHALASQTRQEVEAVCANSSLSLQQKREQIRAIRQREKQQLDTLITPQQEQTLRACQEQRGRGGHVGGGGHAGGPCGEMPGVQERESESGLED
jgi:hypothetical protein